MGNWFLYDGRHSCVQINAPTASEAGTGAGASAVQGGGGAACATVGCWSRSCSCDGLSDGSRHCSHCQSRRAWGGGPGSAQGNWVWGCTLGRRRKALEVEAVPPCLITQPAQSWHETEPLRCFQISGAQWREPAWPPCTSRIIRGFVSAGQVAVGHGGA